MVIPSGRHNRDGLAARPYEQLANSIVYPATFLLIPMESNSLFHVLDKIRSCWLVCAFKVSAARLCCVVLGTVFNLRCVEFDVIVLLFVIFHMYNIAQFLKKSSGFSKKLFTRHCGNSQYTNRCPQHNTACVPLARGHENAFHQNGQMPP